MNKFIWNNEIFPPHLRYFSTCTLSLIFGRKVKWIEKKKNDYKRRIEESRYIR